MLRGPTQGVVGGYDLHNPHARFIETFQISAFSLRPPFPRPQSMSTSTSQRLHQQCNVSYARIPLPSTVRPNPQQHCRFQCLDRCQLSFVIYCAVHPTLWNSLQSHFMICRNIRTGNRHPQFSASHLDSHLSFLRIVISLIASLRGFLASSPGESARNHHVHFASLSSSPFQLLRLVNVRRLSHNVYPSSYLASLTAFISPRQSWAQPTSAKVSQGFDRGGDILS
jgi:hypothetical protein